MISLQREKLAKMTVSELMFPSDKVVHVQVGNPLDHALLVLVKTGYSSVPVVDTSNIFQGIISKSMILEETLGVEQFELDRLSALQVSEVMNTNVPCLSPDASVLDGLKKVIDHPFICVTDKTGYFDGILTRRAMLKQLNKEMYTTQATN
ncbi:cyclic-di-AMP-binding protein CbpB [Thalassobacillus sp. CUG 92003]|uniref:cyclic-di-AMP-binding protein CbpB n=1 Tax=Thalassobacillus sp. CUG 92003 TaxID=2736641 RepID=UPI0015E77105|nr:cyclic-di-AMP-binding protein CbpB [Thalassobacillus sp. CUG 92003]